MTNTHREILENGLDFLLHAVRPPTDYDDESEASVLPKYAVLNLAAACELILKARLCKEHWSLIFQNPDKATLAGLRSGEFVSVNFEKSLSRLRRDCGVELSRDTRDVLSELRNRRNLYQHFRTDVDRPVITSVAARVLATLVDHLEEWFDESDFTAQASDVLSALRARLVDFHGLREARLALIEEDIETIKMQDHAEHCLICGESALALGDPVKCLFCHWTTSAKLAATSQAEREEAARQLRLHQLSLFPEPPLPWVVVCFCQVCGAEACVTRTFDEEGRTLVSSRCYACARNIRTGAA